MGRDLQLVVTHDSPMRPACIPKHLFRLLPAARNDQRGVRLYEDENAFIVKREGRGSASALLYAVDRAIGHGFKYGYIHLDDHTYHPCLQTLMLHSIAEFTEQPSLAWLRFSGYPLISSAGREFKLLDDRVVCDNVVLEPQRRGKYTCWSAHIAKPITEGRYWPIAMWHTLYRLEILRTLLVRSTEHANSLHLAHVEEYFKSDPGAQWLAAEYNNMCFGYINMQFAGFEMHRNPNFKHLLAASNEPVL